jgi:hypothetical protein
MIIEDIHHIIYRVQVLWPDCTNWSTYHRWAFNDIRNPFSGDKRGSFEEMNSDVSDAKSRLPGDTVIFYDVSDARRYASRLAEYGQPQCGWSGPEPWRANYRRPLKTRVVEELLIKRVCIVN